jgi:uncharacterized protein DUF4150
MSNNVFANGMEIACKAGDGKVIAAFPDVCLSPPSPPAGPVPIPYPVTSFASDTTDGSSTVKISGQEVMLKTQSSYKKCTGDEAATKSLGMGVITHCIQGKTYFAAWSSDVKFEGANVDRHGDLTNSNGQSTTNQMGQVNFDSSTFDLLGECDGVSEEYRLVPYKTQRSGSGNLSCPQPLQTGHHLVPGHLMDPTSSGRYQKGNGQCHHNTAPVMCAIGKSQWFGSHYMGHYPADGFETLVNQSSTPQMQYGDVVENAGQSAEMIQNGSAADPDSAEAECVKAQIRDYLEKCGVGESDSFDTASSGLVTDWAQGNPPAPR